MRRAIAFARERLRAHPLVTLTIRRSHHIGCLQAYLKPVTDDGLVIVLTCSDPAGAGVAAHGGVTSVVTPNPLAAGLPTEGEPILFDISMSTTTNAMTKRVADEGGRLPGPWLVDADGRATDDPAVLFGARKGAILPLGGLELGHKGFAIALLVEALTSGLAGHGRAEKPDEWGASVYLQLIDPDGFAGKAAFRRQMSAIADAARASATAPGRRRCACRDARAGGGRADSTGIDCTPPSSTRSRPGQSGSRSRSRARSRGRRSALGPRRRSAPNVVLSAQRRAQVRSGAHFTVRVLRTMIGPAQRRAAGQTVPRQPERLSEAQRAI